MSMTRSRLAIAGRWSLAKVRQTTGTLKYRQPNKWKFPWNKGDSLPKSYILVAFWGPMWGPYNLTIDKSETPNKHKTFNPAKVMATARQSFVNYNLEVENFVHDRPSKDHKPNPHRTKTLSGLPKLMQLGCIEASWKTSTAAAMGRVFGVLDYCGIQINTHTLNTVNLKSQEKREKCTKEVFSVLCKYCIQN